MNNAVFVALAVQMAVLVISSLCLYLAGTWTLRRFVLLNAVSLAAACVVLAIAWRSLETTIYLAGSLAIHAALPLSIYWRMKRAEQTAANEPALDRELRWNMKARQ